MSTNTTQIITEFNSVLLDMIKNIASVCPNSIVGRNIGDIEKTLKTASSKQKIIETFITKVLPYKSKIDNGDEDFFLKKDYSNDFDGNDTWGSKVFEFKNIWTQLNNNNKNIIIQYMQVLCELSQEYFLAIYAK